MMMHHFSGVLKEVLELEGYSLIGTTEVGDIISVLSHRRF
jgi:hypothetical protein